MTATLHRKTHHPQSTRYTHEEMDLLEGMEDFFAANPNEWDKVQKNMKITNVEEFPEELRALNVLHSERLKLGFRSISETNQAILSEMKAGYSAPRMKRTSINLYSEDITRAQEIAKELGVEYQVFLRDFLHRHLEAAFEVYKNI